MKKKLIAAAASVFFIVACGDDSSSNASNDSQTQPTETDTKTGRYQVDESENLLIMIPDSTYRSECVAVGEDFVWERLPLNGPDTLKYEFRGDSLALSAFRNGKKLPIEEVFIGGKSGKFEGTWSQPSFSLTFSDGKLSQTTILDLSQENDENPDFMNSFFMAKLYDAINEGNLLTTAKTIFEKDSSSVQRAIEENKVNIKKNEKTSQVFEMKGKTFSIDIKNATETPIYDGFFFKTVSEIQIELSDGSTTCKLNYSEKLVDKDLCHGEKSEFLVTNVLKNKRGETMRDSEGNEIESATLYRDTGNDSFSECFLKMNLD